jgi:hypothetical protein
VDLPGPKARSRGGAGAGAHSGAGSERPCRDRHSRRGGYRPGGGEATHVRSRRDGEPHQGAAALPLPRSHLGPPDACQPDPALIVLRRLSAVQRAAPARSRRQCLRSSSPRHDPYPTAQNRRLRPDQRPTGHFFPRQPPSAPSHLRSRLRPTTTRRPLTVPLGRAACELVTTFSERCRPNY